MNKPRSEQLVHFFLGALVFAITGASLFFYNNVSEALNSNVTVPNVAPVILSHNIDRVGVAVADGETITPNVGPSSTAIHLTGQVRDDNGDTPAMTSKYYRSGVGDGCAGNAHNCIGGFCSTSPTGDPTVFDYTCTINAPYHIDPTTVAVSPTEDYSGENWIIKITADDGIASPVSDSSSNFEMGGITGLSLPTAFDLGFAQIGTATSEILTTVTNYGNVRIDFRVHSNNDFVCTGGGTIPRDHLRVGNSGTYGSKSPVTSTPTTYSTIDLDRRPASGPDATREVYWQLLTDAPVGSGICTMNQIVFNAVAG